MRLFSLLLVMFMIFTWQIARAEPSPDWVKNLPDAQTSDQMVVVAGVQGTTAWISMHEKIDGQWQMIMSTPGFIGKNGLGKLKEGDAKTPVGSFKFDFAFGIAPDPGCQIPYVQVNEHHYWSGDWNFKYNQFVDDRQSPADFDKNNSEHLIDYDPHYIYGLNMGYNSECIPGKGSALFMHCFGSKYPWTGGCVGLPNDKMLFVMQNIRPGCLCIIDSLKNFGGIFNMDNFSAVDCAYKILSATDKDHPIHFKDLIRAVLRQKNQPVQNEAAAISEIYTQINMDSRFQHIGDGLWGLADWFPSDVKRTRAAKSVKPA